MDSAAVRRASNREDPSSVREEETERRNVGTASTRT